jgi:MFS family permease
LRQQRVQVNQDGTASVLLGTSTSQDSIESPYGWWVACVTLLIASLSFGAVTSIPVLLKPLARDWGTGASTIALVHTSAMIGAGIGSLLLGRLLDRIGFFPIAVVSALATGLGLMLAGGAPNLLTMHVAYGLLVGGIGQGAFFSPLAAAVSQWFDRQRALAIAIAASGQSVGGLILPPLMRWSAEQIGWRNTLQGYGAIAGLLLLACSFVFRRPPPRPVYAASPPPHARAAARLSPGGFALLGLCMALFNIATFVVMAHLTAYGEELGFSPTSAAAIISIMLGVALVSRLSLDQLFRRWGRANVLLAVSALHVAGMVMLPLADNYAALTTAVLLIGLGFGGYVPAYAVVVRELFPASEAGRRIAEIYFFAFVAAGAGSWSGGWVRDVSGSYPAAFALAALADCVGMCLLVWLSRKLRRT